MVKTANTYFRVFGMLYNAEDINNITKFINSSKFPCLACFSKDLTEKIQIIGFIEIANSQQNMKEYASQLTSLVR